MTTELKRGRIKPLRDRGLMRYDQDTIYRIVDEALVCHAGYRVDGEVPEDMALVHWAGVVPLRVTAGPAREDHSGVVVPLPDYMARYELGEGA